MKGTSPTHIFTSMITHEEKLPQGPTLIISHDSSFFFPLPLIHVPIQVDPGAHARGVGLKSSCHGPLGHCSKVCFGGLQNRPRTHHPCIYQVFLSLSKHAPECVMFWKMVGTCTCGWLEWWYRAWQRRKMWPGYYKANKHLGCSPMLFIHYRWYFFHRPSNM